MDVAMGGRVAEEIIFGTENVTSGKHKQTHKQTNKQILLLGASSDFENATRIATAMVTRYGMTEAVCDIYYQLLI